MRLSERNSSTFSAEFFEGRKETTGGDRLEAESGKGDANSCSKQTATAAGSRIFTAGRQVSALQHTEL